MLKDRVARIDTDIEHVGRQKVIDYITKKYGAESVCRIVTFGTMAAKMAIKDVARVMGFPAGWANTLAKLIPEEPKMTLDKAFDMNPELRRRYDSDPDVAKVIDVAKTLEGCKRHASQHACFEAGTLITTKDGLKKIEDIQCGDEVLTHLGRFKSVVDTIVTQTDNVYQVGFYGSPSISVTGNHPLYVRHQSSVKTRTNDGSKTRKRVYDAPIWKPVSDIVNDDYVAIPINQTEELPRLEGLPYKNPDFWWVIGRYIGDGWTEQYHRPEISAGRFERRIIICCGKKNTSKTVTDITEKLESCGFTYRVEECRTTYKVFISSLDPLYDYLDTFGHYAHGKHLTGDILNLPILYAESFLDGYMSADGSFSKAQSIYSMKTVSKPLALGFIQLVNKVFHKAAGLSVCPARQDVIEGRIVQAKEKYQITFTKNNRPMQKSFYEDGLIWVRVKNVSVEVKNQPMYNLTVLDDSSYQANGIAAHNCGLVVAPGKVQNFLPTSMEKDSSGEKSLTSQVVMTEVEALSLLKMDLLGLKNLSAIHEVMDNVEHTRGIKMKYQDLPLDDRYTYKMLAKGLTGGVFQLESAGMTDVIRQMLGDIDTLPDEQMGECFERLIAAVALYRPGPMDYIPDYIRGMMDKNSIHYDCKQEEDILASTYGVMVYQEQLMHIAQALAGYSLGEADLLRKACGKKKKDIMAKERNRFIHGNKDEFDSGKAKHLIPGCIGNGIAPEVAEEIWNKMEKFASYAFNRSHAACYAWIASITAYMACHWPAEFFCAMLNAFEDIGDKVKNYLSLAVRRGVKVLPPDINKSMDKCTVEGDCIRLGLHALSNLNKLSRAIVRVRKDGPFISYQDFYERMNDDGSVNKKALESLIYSGAMDSFGLNRRQMIAMTPALEKNYKNKANVAARALDQICLFSKEELQILPPDVPEYDEKFLMNGEFQTTGFYLGNHPVDLLYSKLKDVSAYTPISDLVVAESPKRVTVTLGILSNLRCVYTKKEEEMYIFSASDRFSTISCVLFPSRVAANKHRLQDGAMVKLVGEFTVDEERGRQIIVQDILGEEEVLAISENSVTVTIQNKEEQERLLTFVKAHPGSAAVKLMCDGKAYNLKGKFHMSPQTLDFLRNNFAKVTA